MSAFDDGSRFVFSDMRPPLYMSVEVPSRDDVERADPCCEGYAEEWRRSNAHLVWQAFQAILALACYGELTLRLERCTDRLRDSYSREARDDESDAWFALREGLRVAKWSDQ